MIRAADNGKMKKQSLEDRERELAAREKAVREKEAELERKEKALDPISQAVKDKKESWYDRVNVSVKTMDKVIGVITLLLIIVVVLIVLEATGVFKL